jgi:hypothetical protein
MNRYQSEKEEVIHEWSRKLDLNFLQRSAYTEELAVKSNRLYFQSSILLKSYPNRIEIQPTLRGYEGEDY